MNISVHTTPTTNSRLTRSKDFAQEPDRKSIEETLERCKHRLPSLTAGSTPAAGGLLLRRSGLFCAFVPFRHRCSGGIQSCRGVVLLRRLGRSCLGPTGWLKDIELPLHRLRRGRRRQDRLHRRDGGRRRSGRGIGMLFFCHLGLRSRGRSLRDGILLLCPAKERALFCVLCGMARGRRATPGCLFRAGLADPLIQFFPRWSHPQFPFCSLIGTSSDWPEGTLQLFYNTSNRPQTQLFRHLSHPNCPFFFSSRPKKAPASGSTGGLRRTVAYEEGFRKVPLCSLCAVLLAGDGVEHQHADAQSHTDDGGNDLRSDE